MSTAPHQHRSHVASVIVRGYALVMGVAAVVAAALHEWTGALVMLGSIGTLSLVLPMIVRDRPGRAGRCGGEEASRRLGGPAS